MDFTNNLGEIRITTALGQDISFSSQMDYDISAVEAPTPGNPQIIFNPDAAKSVRFVDIVIVGKYFDQPQLFLFDGPNTSNISGNSEAFNCI